MARIPINVIIAGAGIVGLATAYQIQRMRPSWKILLLEKEEAPALHQTGRNSGVVHTGVYYKPGSLKAQNCIAGRKELLDFCETNSIPYRKKHKLIVATHPQEFPRLQEISLRGQANGIQNLKLLEAPQVRELEPHVNALQALFIPDCHIVDYKQIAHVLCDRIREKGGEIARNEEVVKIEQNERTCWIETKRNQYESFLFINCTGVFSDRIARASSHLVSHRILPFRGEYFELSPEKEQCVQGLIYPVPDPKFPFLGVHLTPRINGKVEAGPNAILALAREGYKKSDFNWKDVREYFGFPGFWKLSAKHWKVGAYEMARSFSKQLFLRDLRRLLPCLDEKDLIPAGAGIRAQVVTREGKLLDDFALFQEKNCLHVINAPSPAATASFAIGKTLADMAIKIGTA